MASREIKSVWSCPLAIVKKEKKMPTRIIVSLVVVVAVVLTLAPNADASGMLSLLLVLLGLAYVALEVNVGDANDAGAYLILAIACGAAATADVLNHIPGVGVQLDTILGHVSTPLYAGVFLVVALRLARRIRGLA